MGQKGGRDAFVSQGFDTWNKKDAFRSHVGGVDSFHNKAREKCEFLMREKQAINVVLRRQTKAEDNKYKAQLRVSIIVVRLLLKTGLPFRGHDESVNSENRGFYIEVLKAIRETSEEIFNNTLENAPKNNQLISPKIQKELVQCFAQEVLLSIHEEIGQDVLRIDESSDVSKKEQMAIVLRYVDSLGNMQGEFNGLKALILQENDTAFYVHCFAHQLQLVVVDVAKKHDGRGLNQETTLVRAGETRWGSHFNTLTSLMKLFADVLVVLDFVKEEGGSLANHQQASGILAYFKSYEFVFYLHMMYAI
ncbi:uncharacterized protein LOC111897183 [Lactuca sativa]|uniref:uncharacterized protein LOC111897183 n=1 Tax=Lactuca sativa TaxID=4236 RepID=UPI0022AF3BE1|nr:uncharacterized protein LOC111897183 [Lactuca sativa]